MNCNVLTGYIRQFMNQATPGLANRKELQRGKYEAEILQAEGNRKGEVVLGGRAASSL